MARLLNPTRPFRIISEKFGCRKRYILISENSYIYHHFDAVWRIRRLNDYKKFTFRTRKEAMEMKKYFSNYEFPYSPRW